MGRNIFRIMLIGLTSLGVVACSSASAAGTRQSTTGTPNPSSTAVLANMPTPTATQTLTPTPEHGTFKLNAYQVQEVSVFMDFIHALNDGQLQDALALLDDKVIGNDCDYQAVNVITFGGKSGAEEWLRQRIADHDQLQVWVIENENPDPGSGSHVIGVEWARRKSDSLAKLGFPDGITPKLGAKVVFSTNPTRISGLANGPGGGDLSFCRPESN